MSGIAVWSIRDNGDVPPLLMLTDPAGQVPGRKLAFNPKANEIIVDLGLRDRTSTFIARSGSLTDARALMATAWDVAEIEQAYKDFVATFSASKA